MTDLDGVLNRMVRWCGVRQARDVLALSTPLAIHPCREKRREAPLRAVGYRIERVTWADVRETWAETRLWLAAALWG